MNLSDVIQNLVGGNISETSSGEILYNSGQTPPTEEEIEAEKVRMQSEYDNDYARKRQAEYPSIQECIHAILDDDLIALQEKRQAVKTKHPKG